MPFLLLNQQCQSTKGKQQRQSTEEENKEDNHFFSHGVQVVYSRTFISLFITTVIQLLLFAKHWVGLIAMSYSQQTATMHNKLLETFP